MTAKLCVLAISREGGNPNGVDRLGGELFTLRPSGWSPKHPPMPSLDHGLRPQLFTERRFRQKSGHAKAPLTDLFALGRSAHLCGHWADKNAERPKPITTT